jgi:hypothetical protein
MIKVIDKSVRNVDLDELAQEIGGFFIKIVVDIEREVLVAGAKMHIDEEKVLLEQGSKQQSLWGGGYDLETKQVSFDSIINNKPGMNSSSDILDPNVRMKFEIITKRLLRI